MKDFSFKKVLAFIKKKKSIFITLAIVIVVAIGLTIASSIMNSSRVSLNSAPFRLDEDTAIEAGTVSGGGRYRRGATITVKATPNPGYKFVGWTNGDKNETLASEEAAYTMIVPEKSITLTAHWEQVVYNVDLVIGEGEGGTIHSTYVVTDDTIFLDEPAEREGYAFLGWLADETQEDGSVKRVKVQDFIEPTDVKDVKLYADWAESYNITYVLDEDPRAARAANPNNPSSYTERDSVTLESPVCYEFDAENKLTGGWYRFDHWEMNGQTVTSIDKDLKADVTLVAKWADLDTPIYHNVITENGATYVEFGQFPSRRLSDRKVLGELKAAIANEEIAADPVTGYYTFKNSIYAKGTADLYSKPLDDKGKKNSAYYPLYFEDGTLIDEGEEYFFIVEPIKWRVLSGDPTKNEDVVLMAESVLTAYTFKADGTTISAGGQNIYGGNWEYSGIRDYLNNEFYNKAFKSGEAGFIRTTTVDYSKDTVNKQYKNEKWANGTSCEDKVYLLSYADLTNTSYGWSDSSKSEDLKRVAKNTDYSKTMGAYSCLNRVESGNSMSKDEYDFAVWWLRSTTDFADRASVVTGPGAIGSAVVTSDFVGVRPAITVRFPAQ
ncbi:MAG: InlB B-repeat-containing protein [Clostridia bacterium]|nr:InlB B-repeat-containing protein [Clostridia bacterium]